MAEHRLFPVSALAVNAALFLAAGGACGGFDHLDVFGLTPRTRDRALARGSDCGCTRSPARDPEKEYSGAPVGRAETIGHLAIGGGDRARERAAANCSRLS